MPLNDEFWEKWTKHHVPYKVVKYLCGCKYVFPIDKESLIIGNHTFCPKHRKAKEYVVLWCESCGVKVKAKPQAGYRQKRCLNCTGEFLKEYNRLNWVPEYAKNKKRQQIAKSELQEINDEEELKDITYLAVARFIKSLKNKFVYTDGFDEYLRKKKYDKTISKTSKKKKEAS